MQDNLKNQINWLLQEKYQGKMTALAKRDIARLRKGEPVDYIIGFTDFLGCRIDLSKKPLIPRVETEFWVEKAIKDIGNPSSLQSSGQNLRILDMFAGSGCIGIAVLKNIKNSEVVFADSDRKSLEQIKINLKINLPALATPKALQAGKINKKRYKIIHSDIFSNSKFQSSQELESKFDYIFANSPYIPNNQKTRYKIQESVLKFEPHTALFGGEDGMLYIKKFLASAKNFLNPSGTIYMEFDSIQKKLIEKLLKKYGYKKFQFHRDQYGKWRWVVIKNKEFTQG